jgi:hypothetical protein
MSQLHRLLSCAGQISATSTAPPPHPSPSSPRSSFNLHRQHPYVNLTHHINPTPPPPRHPSSLSTPRGAKTPPLRLLPPFPSGCPATPPSSSAAASAVRLPRWLLRRTHWQTVPHPPPHPTPFFSVTSGKRQMLNPKPVVFGVSCSPWTTCCVGCGCYIPHLREPDSRKVI